MTCAIRPLAVLLAVVIASAAWCGDAVAAKAPELEVEHDLPYRAAGADAYATARCVLDIYRPQAASGLPVLVWFHGGGLEGGDKASKVTMALARRFAADGMVVMSAEYRLSPQVQAPAYIADAAAAVAWAAAHAGEHGGDPRALFVAGHSAGGYLAAILAADGHYLGDAGLAPDAVAGVIPVSGQTFTHFTIRKERGVADPEHTPVVDAFAPCFHVAKAKAMPPLLLLCGDHDWVARADENRYFLTMLKSCGARDAAYVEIPDRNHGSIIGRMPDPADPAAQAITAFIAAHRPPPR